MMRLHGSGGELKAPFPRINRSHHLYPKLMTKVGRECQFVHAGWQLRKIWKLICSPINEWQKLILLKLLITLSLPDISLVTCVDANNTKVRRGSMILLYLKNMMDYVN